MALVGVLRYSLMRAWGLQCDRSPREAEARIGQNRKASTSRGLETDETKKEKLHDGPCPNTRSRWRLCHDQQRPSRPTFPEKLFQNSMFGTGRCCNRIHGHKWMHGTAWKWNGSTVHSQHSSRPRVARSARRTRHCCKQGLALLCQAKRPTQQMLFLIFQVGVSRAVCKCFMQGMYIDPLLLELNPEVSCAVMNVLLDSITERGG